MWSRSGSTSSERSTRSSAVPTSWRARTGAGSRAISAEDDPGQQRRQHGRAEHAELRLLELLPLEGDARDQQRDREPDAGDGPAPGDLRPAQASAQPGRAATRATPRRGSRAACPPRSRTGFPSVIGDVTASPSSCAVEVDAGVREREQRHDHEAGPGMEPVLEPLVRGDRGRDAQLRRARELGRGLLAERARQLRHALEVGARRRIRARDEADREPGDDRVDARLVAARPRWPRRGSTAAGPRQAIGAYRSATSDAEEAERRSRAERTTTSLRVHRGDHEQRHEVVEDRERQQADAQARAAGSHQREHAEREGGVGRHRGSPAVRARRRRR